jgi:hypothetical protein
MLKWIARTWGRYLGVERFKSLRSSIDGRDRGANSDYYQTLSIIAGWEIVCLFNSAHFPQRTMNPDSTAILVVTWVSAPCHRKFVPRKANGEAGLPRRLIERMWQLLVVAACMPAAATV